MPVFEVLEFDDFYNCHRVKDSEGKIRLVDLLVNGDFPEGTEPQSLIGTTVECEYEFPYVAIAMYVRQVEAKPCA